MNRLRDSIIEALADMSYPKNTSFATKLADSILALPEMQRLLEMEGKVAKREYVIDLKESELKELREKAEKFDSLCDLSGGYSKLNTILDKAEKWDREHPNGYNSPHQALIDCQKDLFTIMSGLVVEEKCPHTEWDVEDVMRVNAMTCKYCHGKGYTTRPATAGEVREMIRAMLCRLDFDIYKVASEGVFPLKSGGRMRLSK